MPAFTHFYIVTESGTCIYSRSVQTHAEEHLLPGFMTALEGFAQKILAGDIESVSMGKSKYYALSAHKLLFIARTDLNAKDSLARDELEDLQEIFFRNFPAEKHSDNWDTLKDTTLTLDASYSSYFKDSDQKMREAVW